jgi:hypothetical protein
MSLVYKIKYVMSKGVLDTTLCDKIARVLRQVAPCTPVSFTNKTDRHDIAELLLKVALNTITKNIFLYTHFQSTRNKHISGQTFG